MTIKVLCQCGTKFAFDIEPIDGRMPAPVSCPACGADATEFANSAIGAQTESPKVVSPALVPLPPSGPMRIGLSREGHAPPSTEAPPVPESPAVSEGCAKHHGQPAAANCVVCQKPICLDCMAQFGYLCSSWCKEVARKKGIDVPFYEHQKVALIAKEDRKGNRILVAFALLVTLLASLTIWYLFFASKPSTVVRLEASSSAPFVFTEWAGPDRFLALSAQKLSLHDASSGKQIWEATFKPGEAPAKGGNSTAKSGSAQSVQCKSVGNDLWVFFPNAAVRFDDATGKRKTEVSVPSNPDETAVGETGFVTVSEAGPLQKTVSYLDLASGQLQSLTVTQAFNRAMVSSRLSGSGGNSASSFDEGAREFFPVDGGLVRLQARLIERRITRVDTIRPQGKSVLDSGDLRASQSSEATREFLNQSKRDNGGGYREEDESRYLVTLDRLVGSGAGWSGEVVGLPVFFPQRKLDLLVAGKTVYAFNRSGQKIWESKLTYPIAPHFLHEETNSPCLETGSRLYFFDQGNLTAFDPGNGQVSWRVPSVGISALCTDQAGKLYVSTTTAGPESIKYSEDIALTEKIHPLILKVDPSQGAILWQKEKLGERAYTSGKFLYVSRGRVSGVDRFAAISNGDNGNDLPVYHRIHRLDPENGTELWEFYRPKPPLSIDPRQNRLLLLYSDEIQIIKFFSF